LDREEFYRLKKVSGKKEREAKIAETARLAKKQAASEAIVTQGEEGAKDLLADEDNEDVIF
jgi:V-type H+-transporting ATPase subunit D